MREIGGGLAGLSDKDEKPALSDNEWHHMAPRNEDITVAH